MFSIVIPLYNKEKYIKRSVLSVLLQTYKDFELIVVDDGSTDNSVEALMEIHDTRLFVVKQLNLGVSAARNVGINNSRYPYIAFLDADDYWDENYLEKIVMLIKKYGNNSIYTTGYSINYGKQRLIRNIKTANSDVTILNPKQYFMIMVSNNWGIHTSSAVIPKAVLNAVGCFPVGVSHGEDSFLWDRAASIYRVIHLPKVLSHYDGDVFGQLTKQAGKYGLPATALGLYELSLGRSLDALPYIKRYLVKLIGRKFIQDIWSGWNLELSSGDLDIINWINFKQKKIDNTKLKVIILSLQYLTIIIFLKFKFFKNADYKGYHFNSE